MRRGIQTMLGVVLAATVVACSNDKRPNDAANAETTPREGAVGTSGVSTAERSFIEEELKDNQKEVALSQLAADRATNPEVKKFAQMVARDHQKAGEDLHQVAAQANVQITDRDADDVKDATEDLSKKSGRDFDRAYLDKMIDEHQKELKELEKKAGDADNPQVRQWAAKTAPVVAKHLAQAQELKRQVDSEKRS